MISNLADRIRELLGTYEPPHPDPRFKFDVLKQLDKMQLFIQQKRILDDIVENYDAWMSEIAKLDSLDDVEAVQSALAPAFSSIYSWDDDVVTKGYLKHRIKYADKLKSALEKKSQSLKLAKRDERPKTNAPTSHVVSQQEHASKLEERVKDPTSVVVASSKVEEVKVAGPDWKYEPTLMDLLDYYRFKGVIGEEAICILQTLGAIDRLCFGLESLSGSGKSYVVETLLDLLPSDQVYRMELSSKTAEMYQADAINACKIIYLPELQKAMSSNNHIIVEVLKGLTEGKDVTRKVRDQSSKSIEKYVITGDKGVIFTLAVENQYKYDAEFSRRVFILQTDISEKQTDKILKFKASKRHAFKQKGFGEEDFNNLAAHVRECLNFPEVAYENPFAEYIATQIPRTIRARSYDDYLFDLMDASAKFHFKNRALKDNVLFLNLEDVYAITTLYWKQFCKGLLKVPVFGEDVMAVFEQGQYSSNQVYTLIKDDNPSYTFKMVEQTLESLADAGFLEKDDYKSTKPKYSKVKDLFNFEQQFNWKECWEHGLRFMQEHYPKLVDDWVLMQTNQGEVSVLDPLNGEQITVYKENETN